MVDHCWHDRRDYGVVIKTKNLFPFFVKPRALGGLINDVCDSRKWPTESDAFGCLNKRALECFGILDQLVDDRFVIVRPNE